MSLHLRLATLSFAKLPTCCFNRAPFSDNSFRCRRLLSPAFSLPEEIAILPASNEIDDQPFSPSVDTSLELKKRSLDLCSVIKGTSIYLIGPSCPLKSSLGKLLADAFSYYYFDSDELVAQAFGGESVVKSLKENEVKEAETEVFKQLTGMGRLVVCAGDGAVQSATNLGLLRHGISIWLDVPAEEFSGEEDAVRVAYATADAAVSVQRVANKLGYEKMEDATEEDLAIEVFKEIEKLTRAKKMIEEAGRPF